MFETGQILACFAVWLREELVDWNLLGVESAVLFLVWLREELVDWNMVDNGETTSVSVWLREELVDWNNATVFIKRPHISLAPRGASGLKVKVKPLAFH